MESPIWSSALELKCYSRLNPEDVIHRVFEVQNLEACKASLECHAPSDILLPT